MGTRGTAPYRCRLRLRQGDGMDYDAAIVGAGLAGLIAANERVQAGRRVALLDQENASNLGGQAYWSFGGLFLVDSPEQRRLGVRDSVDLAWSDWQASARWDRFDGDLGADVWARRWGRAYVEFAAGEERDWLRRQGVRLTPMVGVGRARRRPRRGPRQLRAPVPCGVGHGNRRQRSVRSAGVGGRTAGRARSAVRSRSATPQIDNPFAKDLQIQGLPNARRYLGDRLARVAKPHKLLDPKAGPLIAVKLHVLTRKSLGGIQTDLESRVLKADGSVMEGLFAAGEVAGFGGGGAHGYNALEGSFLGGCIFTGRAAGPSMP